MNECAMRARVDQHFEGTIGPSAERAMREHLPGCESCRDLYRRHLLFNQLDPEHALLSEERIAIGLGFRGGRSSWVPWPRARWSRAVIPGAFVAAAAAAALLVLKPRPAADHFAARGSVALPGAPYSRVFVYDIGRGVSPTPIGSTLDSGHELAFAYVNGAAKRRLAIFGVDETGHVYWFYPAWTNESLDPVAIPIEPGEQRHELPEAIRHHFVGSRLVIRSLFLDEPLSVRQIEALVQKDGQRPLAIPSAIESSVSLEVTP